MGSRFALLIAAIALSATWAPTTMAWHAPDETPSERHGAMAGDARFLEDAARCLAATSDDDEVACAVLYAHIIHPLRPASLTLHRPPDCLENLAQGFTGTPGIEPLWKFSRMTLRHGQGFVEYNVGRCDAKPSEPHVFGVFRDLVISDAGNVTGHWTLSADTFHFSPAGNGDGPSSNLPSLGIMPCVTVRMALMTGRTVETGASFATAQTTMTVASFPGEPPDPGLLLADPCPGSAGTLTLQETTEFVVDFGPVAHTVPKYEPLLLFVQWYQWDGNDPHEENNAIQREWILHTGPEHVPRLVLPITNPLSLEEVKIVPLPRYERARIPDEPPFQLRFIASSPWGRHDLDLSSSRLTLHDANGAVVPLQHLSNPRLQDYPDTDGYVQILRIEYGWDIRGEQLAPGTYTLRFSASNWQHTGHLDWTGTLSVEPHGITLDLGEHGTFLLQDEQSRAELPAPGIPFVLIALLLWYGVRYRGSRPHSGGAGAGYP